MQLGQYVLRRATQGPPPWAKGAPEARPPAREPASTAAPPAPPGAVEALPNRYRVRTEGRDRVLTCVEAPTVRVVLRRGVTVTAAAARSHPPGSIFLDGAAQGEPFLDPERAVYNLDHHEGCIRAFTLATCEQAMVLIRKRLDLRKRDWTVYANDADLDTVLAVWVLLNHLRLAGEESKTRAAILPLLRLEGVIDALGLELEDLCALPPAALDQARQQMQGLLARERQLKAEGRWEKVDLSSYVAAQLRAIDRLVYPAAELEHVAEVEELARSEIAPGSVAVVCRSKLGIYELERQLLRVHGERLGMIVLQKNPATYTLRQVDPTLPGSLDRVYARLNLIDRGSDGAASPNRWGGSEEIGGSPRASGTRLTPAEIAEACRRAHAPPSLATRLARLGRAVAWSALAALGLAAPRLAPLLPAPWNELATSPGRALTLAIGIVAGLALLLAGRRAPGVYGLRRPAGLGPWALMPLALLGACAGGVWLPTGVLPAPDPAALAVFLGLPVAVELLFRGLVHGSLAADFSVQHPGGPWWVSWPVVVSAGLYAAWTVLAGLAVPPLPHLALAGPTSLVPVVGALGFGLATGMARERSGSIATPVLFHLAGVGAWLLARLLLG